MRSTRVLLALCFSALLPAPAFAVVAPTNDTAAGAIALQPAYSPPWVVGIAPDAPTGGWVGASNTEDATSGLSPSCLGTSGWHSMWYSLHVTEASVLKAALRSDDTNLFKPVISIIDAARGTEIACALAGNALPAGTDVVASSYVAAGDYLIRIASATNPDPSMGGLPTVTLTETLRDVTPPQIRVESSKTVGVGKTFTFDARTSTDGGIGVDATTASWVFMDSGRKHLFSGADSPTPEVATYVWKTSGLHLVSVSLSDKQGNTSTYSFNVFVHNFVPPRVSMVVVPPKPGASQVRILLTHDQPVRVRLVVLQGGAILRTVPSKAFTGSRVTTSITIPLLHRIANTGYVFVSGTASDLSANPNTVPLGMCSVRPGQPGNLCA
jgi:hypothetical protein